MTPTITVQISPHVDRPYTLRGTKNPHEKAVEITMTASEFQSLIQDGLNWIATSLTANEPT